MNKKMIGIVAAVGIVCAAMCQTMVRVQQLAETYSAPQLVQVTSNNTVTVLATNSLRGDGRVVYRTIQNTGTNPVFYLINSTNVTTANYHGILAGGTATRDGRGGLVDLSATKWPISLRTESGTTVVSVVEMTQ